MVKPGTTMPSILVDNCQKSGSTRVYQAHQAFNQTFGARVFINDLKVWSLHLSKIIFSYEQLIHVR